MSIGQPPTPQFEGGDGDHVASAVPRRRGAAVLHAVSLRVLRIQRETRLADCATRMTALGRSCHHEVATCDLVVRRVAIRLTTGLLASLLRGRICVTAAAAGAAYSARAVRSASCKGCLAKPLGPAFRPRTGTQSALLSSGAAFSSARAFSKRRRSCAFSGPMTHGAGYRLD